MPAAAAAASGVVRTSWEPTVDAFWAVNRTTILDAMQNGQCTQWAADRRPDIVRRVIRALVARELAAHQSEYWGDWTARDWVGLASTAHIPHGAMPRAGAIAVFQPGVDNAEAGTGHVAYVERVNADGSVRISEMAAPTLGKISYRTLTRAQARAAGLAYIYR
jgi:surface antigen